MPCGRKCHRDKPLQHDSCFRGEPTTGTRSSDFAQFPAQGLSDAAADVSQCKGMWWAPLHRETRQRTPRTATLGLILPSGSCWACANGFVAHWAVAISENAQFYVKFVLSDNSILFPKTQDFPWSPASGLF